MKSLKKLSICMIAKNEEGLIEQCLDSVKHIADEIILVDTGSTDKTVEIARRFEAKTFNFSWVDDFSAARNKSIEHASGDFILVIDADETISKEDCEKIKNLVEKDDFDAASLIQRTYTDDSSSPSWKSSKNDSYDESKKYSGWFETRLLRLFRQDKRIFYQNKVHESVENSVREFGGKIIITGIPIHHFGKVLGDDAVRKKGELYLKLGKKKLEDEKSAKAYFELGVQAKELGKTGQAVEAFKNALKMDERHIKSYINLGALYAQDKQLEKAESVLKKALAFEPENSDLHNNLGVVLQKQGKIQDAEQEYNKSIQSNNSNLEPYQNLAGIYFSQKRAPELVEMLKKVIDINPRAVFAYVNLGAIYGQTGKHREALALLKKALEIDPKNIDVLSNLGVVMGITGNYKESIRYLKKAAEIRQNEPQILMNLATSYEKNRDYEHAVDSLERVSELLPAQKDTIINKAKALKEKIQKKARQKAAET